MKNTSPWFDSVPDSSRYSGLSSKLKTDVIVLGGGMVGVIAAWHIAKAGKKVVLLEKNHLASNDTGYTTAFLTRVPDTSLAELKTLYGKKFIDELFAKTVDAQQLVYKIIQEYNIDCDFKICSSFNYSATPNNAQLLDDKETLIDIQNTEFHTGSNIPDTGISMAEAIEYKNEARFDVRKFIFGLLQTDIGKNISVYEESEAIDVIVEKNRVIVKTNSGAIVGEKIILATGLPIDSFKELRPLIRHNITFALAAEYKEPIMLADNLYWDSEQPYHYFRLLNSHTLILGGSDQSGDTPIPEGDAAPHTKLEAFLKTILPEPYTITNTWSGSLFQTKDGLPYIAPHPYYTSQVFFATGLEGNGMVMGVMAGKMLADFVTQDTTTTSNLFSLERTGVTVEKPTPHTLVQPSKAARKNSWLGWLLPLLFISTIWLPAYAYFYNRGGVGFLEGMDFKTGSIFIFPLVGLYAFYFVWAQLLLGSCINVLRPLSKWFERWHRVQGIFALLFALSHPLLIVIGYGLEPYLQKQFISDDLAVYVLLGQIQLFVLLVTVTAAILSRLPFIKRYWQYIHMANYVVFIMVWIHSWFIGSDVRITPLKYLWWGFGVTMILSTVWRIYRGVRKTPAVVTGSRGGEYVAVGNVESIPTDKPFFIEIEGKQLVLFNLKGKLYAMDNLCGHASGPLNQGRYDGKTIECPWHRSKFDITTGAVINGPARRAQTMYTVRVVNKEVQVQL